MDCGVQVEVSKVLLLLLLLGVVVVVVFRQLQALEMRWRGGVSWAFGGFMQAWRYGRGYRRAAGCDTAWCCLGTVAGGQRIFQGWLAVERVDERTMFSDTACRS